MLNRFKLSVKFSVILLLIFLLGSMVTGLVLSQILTYRAEQRIMAEGLSLMQSINAVRNYTSVQVRPLLEMRLSEEEFLAETVPSYAARQVFERIKVSDTQYALVKYKEAVLNPTNPNDQADEFERELIQKFQDQPELREFSDFRRLADGEMWFLSARPIALRDETCLRCHGLPDDAPQAMLEIYGREHGFNWNLGQIIGSQIVYVPAEKIFQSAKQAFSSVMGLFVAIFAIAILSINLLLKPTVLQPLQYLARVSQKLGAGDMASSQETDTAETQRLERVAARQDELGQLASVFRNMVQAVMIREQELRQQVANLRIEIDQARREREVADITDNEFFRDLQSKAKDYRQRSRRTKPAAPDTPSNSPNDENLES